MEPLSVTAEPFDELDSHVRQESFETVWQSRAVTDTRLASLSPYDGATSVGTQRWAFKSSSRMLWSHEFGVKQALPA